jgi:hypothetical protein
MDAMALTHSDHSSSRWVAYWSALLTYWVAMSRRDFIEKLWKREELSLRQKFDAYLEGYMMAFDPYPVCRPNLFAQNDAYALWLDFFAVGEDMNKAARKLLTAPDEEFAKFAGKASGVGQDGIRRRRIEAAKRTIAAIEQVRSRLERDAGRDPEQAYQRARETDL